MAARAQSVAGERVEARVGGGPRPALYVVALIVALCFITPYFWTVSISLSRMMPIGWFSLIAFSIWTWRSRSLTSTSILLVSTDFRDKNRPPFTE